MNSRLLIERVLRGEPSPRVPSGPLAVHFCAQWAGLSIREYTSDARRLAESVVRYYERFRPDAVWVSADTWVSAQAMGARVGATENHQPWGGLGGAAVSTARDIDRIAPPDPANQGRYPLMLEALQRVVDALGHDAFVVACFDQYPFSLAAQMLGINVIMIKLIEDRPFVQALMERCLEYGVAYATAMARAGAHMLSGGDSPAGLIGPKAYRSLAMPYEKRLISQLKAQVKQPVSLHICGEAAALLPDMAATGADVLEIDHKVDLARACREVSSRVTLWGNLDPVGLLAQGTPGAVEGVAQAAIETARAAGRTRFVLSSGCTLAMETPAVNLDAMLQAARRS